jgi:uncharacterized membrane protein YccC
VSAQQTPAPKDLLSGGIGLLMVLCCLAGPAVFDAIGGSAVGGVLGIALAVALALAVTGVMQWRSRKGRKTC